MSRASRHTAQVLTKRVASHAAMTVNLPWAGDVRGSASALKSGLA